MSRKFLTVLLTIPATVVFAMAVATPSLAATPQIASGHGSATLSGVVLGPDDKPVPHASVTYQSGDGSAPHATRADVHGRFVIRKLRGDNYDVRASSNGIFSEWEKNVMVRSGQSHFVALHLIYATQMPASSTVIQHKPK